MQRHLQADAAAPMQQGMPVNTYAARHAYENLCVHACSTAANVDV